MSGAVPFNPQHIVAPHCVFFFLLSGSFIKCLGGHTFRESNSNVSNHWIPDRHDHLPNLLSIVHRILLSRKNCCVFHDIHDLHNLDGYTVVQHHIESAYYIKPCDRIRDNNSGHQNRGFIIHIYAVTKTVLIQ